jgi:hypothetical protein
MREKRARRSGIVVKDGTGSNVPPIEKSGCEQQAEAFEVTSHDPALGWQVGVVAGEVPIWYMPA